MTRAKEPPAAPTQFEIRPGIALGCLELGMSLYRAVEMLRQWPATFPRIEIVHEADEPITRPVVVDLRPNGIRLQFDGVYQRLCLVEIVDMSKSRFVYKGTDLSKQGAVTFRHIYSRMFGPTYPGTRVKGTGKYVLSYPGIAFSFDVGNDGVDGDDDDDGYMAKYLSGTDSPVCEAVAIFHGASWDEASETIFDEKLEPQTRQPIEVDRVDVFSKPRTCTFHLATHENSVRDGAFDITLGSTTMQDILMALGAPDERVFKQDSRLSIHNPGEQRHGTNSDLFLNYFRYGVDVCLDTTVPGAPVKKLVLHGNLPDTLQFQRYERCRWKISTLGVTSESLFSESQFGVENRAPMMFNRRTLESPASSIELVAVDDDIAEAAFNAEDWGITQLHGSRGLVFEVLRSDVVASLTVYDA